MLTKAEDLALGLTLCEWPEGLSFSEIMEVLRNDNDDDVISVYYLYEGIPNEDVATIIEDIKESIVRVYGE